jgi:flagellar motor switch protein FliM
MSQSEPLTESSPELLANLLVRAEVELNSRRFTIEQLANLSPGQLIDLGVTAQTAFDLIVERRRIARGELVEIEGQLGLRILNLYR